MACDHESVFWIKLQLPLDAPYAAIELVLGRIGQRVDVVEDIPRLFIRIAVRVPDFEQILAQAGYAVGISREYPLRLIRRDG